MRSHSSRQAWQACAEKRAESVSHMGLSRPLPAAGSGLLDRELRGARCQNLGTYWCVAVKVKLPEEPQGPWPDRTVPGAPSIVTLP